MNPILLDSLTQIYSAQGQTALRDPASIFSISNGSILVENGKISRIGTAEDVRRQLPPATRIIDMAGRVAVPSFVDPHTHLVWGGERSAEFNQRLHGADYVKIAADGGGIKSTVTHTRDASHETLFLKSKHVLDQMLLHGIGTIEAKSGYGLDTRTELKQLDVMDDLNDHHPIDIVQTFLGAHEVPLEYENRPTEYIQFMNQELLPLVKQRGTVPYVDIFCEKGVFELEDSRLHLESALSQGFKLRIHADELSPLGGAGLAAELGAVSADHIVHASTSDMRKMAQAGTVATLLPGTSFFLRSRYADPKAFQEAGCAIALSTDFNPGSSHLVSQALVMALACMNMGMTFEQSFLATTLNAAATLDLAERLGTLEVGKDADITFLDAPQALHLVYHWGVNQVSDVMKSGHFVVRNRTLCY